MLVINKLIYTFIYALSLGEPSLSVARREKKNFVALPYSGNGKGHVQFNSVISNMYV